MDFPNEFCISTCQKPPMEDGIDWQQSEGLFLQALEALETLDMYPSLAPTSVEHKKWLGFYFESIESLCLQVLHERYLNSAWFSQRFGF